MSILEKKQKYINERENDPPLSHSLSSPQSFIGKPLDLAWAEETNC